MGLLIELRPIVTAAAILFHVSFAWSRLPLEDFLHQQIGVEYNVVIGWLVIGSFVWLGWRAWCWFCLAVDFAVRLKRTVDREPPTVWKP